MPQSSRRTFLKAGLYAGITIITAPNVVRSAARNEKLRMACIGTGGQAYAGIGAALGQQPVALADVDIDKRGAEGIGKIKAKFPDVKVYTDFRKLFEEQKQLDAVWIAIPDHNHFAAAIRAIEGGAGVYCEKPLTYSIWEARKLREAARAKKVATQMGNQGHSSGAIRILCEYIWAGLLGDIPEVHCATDRSFHAGDRQGATPPANLDWEAWLGPAPERKYHKGLHPFDWRGWLDFGTGSLGDMACHIMDGSVWGLKLTDAANVEVEAELGKPSADGYPAQAIINYKFPARGTMPPLLMKWYQGGKLPPRPAALEAGRRQEGAGTYYLGTKNTMYTSDHCESLRIIPESKQKATPPPPQTIPRVQGGHGGDFLRACKGGEPSSCNFEYAVRLTEIVLLGNIACRVGEKVTYDFATGKTNSPKADAFLKRDPRKGWEFGYT